MLVVEDSVGVRELQRVILEGAGYDVVTAVDGLDGASRLQRDPADLVLSDVEMPGMDGFTLTRTIRGTRGWENVPVVIMTSRGDEADKRPAWTRAPAPTCSRASSTRTSSSDGPTARRPMTTQESACSTTPVRRRRRSV